MIDQAMIMAAGMGSRLKPFTDILPKPLLPLFNRPLIGWVLEQAASSGVTKVVINHHYRSKDILTAVPAMLPRSMQAVMSDESGELLGSAGGIARALNHFSGAPFFLMNSDVIVEADLSALAMHHQRLRRSLGVRLTLGLRRRSPPGADYRRINVDEGSSTISGFAGLEREVPFYAGVAVLEGDAVQGISGDRPSEFVPEILEPAIRDGKAGFFWLDDAAIWEDVGSPELWWHAHARVIQSWETLPSYWRDRLNAELLNHHGVVLPKGSPVTGIHTRAPAFWDGSGTAPDRLGPGEFIYGERPPSPSSSSPRKRIVFRGTEKSFD